jgi:hypothetical protein
MAEKDKKPTPPPPPPPPPPPSSSDDLTPRGNLPEKSVIPEWRQFGYGASTPPPKPKAPKKPEKKYASGGSVSSASKRADGCATKGKTRGRMI